MNMDLPFKAIAFLVLLVSLLQCFFGYALFRFFIALIGFLVIGGLAGVVAYSQPDFDSVPLATLIGLVVGVLGGWLAWKLYKLAVFVWGAGAGALLTILVYVANETSPDIWVVGIAAIASGVIALVLQKAWIILTSSAVGAAGLMIAVPVLAGTEVDMDVTAILPATGDTNAIILLTLWLTLTAVGAAFQYWSTGRRAGAQPATQSRGILSGTAASGAASPPIASRLALAAAVLVVAVGSGGGWWFIQKKSGQEAGPGTHTPTTTRVPPATPPKTPLPAKPAEGPAAPASGAPVVREEPERQQRDVPRDDWGPEIVPDSAIDLASVSCRGQELRACLSGLGLSQQAIAFSIAAGGDLAGESFATEFHELGRVDMARVNYPFAPWEGTLLLNGTPSIIAPHDERQDLRRDFTDGASRSLLTRFPQATGWAAAVAGHRSLGDAGQRFILTTVLLDGCRACPVVGTAITFLDFDTTGKQVARRNIGLMDTSQSDEADQGAWSRSVLKANPAYLQYRLNLLGYDAGPMDGVPGRKTAEALMTFQQDQCLPVTGALNPATLDKLVSADPFSAPCPSTGPRPADVVDCGGTGCGTPGADKTAAVHAPARGSAEREGIMDASREGFSNKKVLFLVHDLRVSGDWAWANVTGTLNGEPAYESQSNLVTKSNGARIRIASVDGSGECSDDPVCYRQDPTVGCAFAPVCSSAGFDKLVARLKAEFPQVPLAIFG